MRNRKQDYLVGKQHEKLFRDLTGATEADAKDEKRHIDCYWKGFSVDVKGAKQSHADGYALVEFANVAGKEGWAVKGPDLIAFMFPERFVVVRRKDLHDMAQRLVLKHSKDTHVTRSSGVPAENGVYRMLGRPSRKDVFTYVTIKDLYSLTYVEVEIK
jgi:hypothetical protein